MTRKHWLSLNVQNIHLLNLTCMSTLVCHGYINEWELMSEKTEVPSPTSLVTLICDLCAKFTMVSLIITERNRRHLAVEWQPQEVVCSCFSLHCCTGKYARKVSSGSNIEPSLHCSRLSRIPPAEGVFFSTNVCHAGYEAPRLIKAFGYFYNINVYSKQN